MALKGWLIDYHNVTISLPTFKPNTEDNDKNDDIYDDDCGEVELGIFHF